MNKKNTFRNIALLILIMILLNSIYKVAVFSAFIDETAMDLTRKPSKYYSWFYDVTEISKNKVTVHYGMMGGNVELGTLQIDEETTITIELSKRSGEIKLLLVNDTLQPIYFDNISNTDTFELPKGSYDVIVVCSWFSGKYSLGFVNGTFTNK